MGPLEFAKCMHGQLHIQNFEKGDVNFMYFTRGHANLKKMPTCTLRPKLGV